MIRLSRRTAHSGNWLPFGTTGCASNIAAARPTAEKPILESLGVAESAHDWPAQKLLDYGNTVLGSLRPGMVFVGGTDPGRFIPTLLNETGDGERHVIVTQNGLAAGSYLDYLSFLYGDRFVGQANLFADRNYTTEAEQTYRLSMEMWPRNIESISGLSDLLLRNGRAVEARRLVEDFARNNSDLTSALESLRPGIIVTTQSPRPPRP